MDPTHMINILETKILEMVESDSRREDGLKFVAVMSQYAKDKVNPSHSPVATILHVAKTLEISLDPEEIKK